MERRIPFHMISCNAASLERVKAKGAVRDVAEALRRVVAELPAGEVRAGQLEMARAVGQALASSSEGQPSALAVAAGTGTGKSFAYLVPALLSGKKIVVATATKALQDQLAEKDLPLVAKALGTKTRWAVLKGRSNYLCRQRLDEMGERGQQATLEESLGGSLSSRRSSELGAEIARIVDWSEETSTGERAELAFEPSPRAWSSLSVSAEECPGPHRCPVVADCFAEKARAKAAQADVVVVNLHLLGADLRSGGAVLPEHDALIVDEAHELEDVVASSLGVDVSPGRIRAAAAGARSAASDTSVVEGVIAAAARFEAALAERADERLPAGLGDGVGGAVRLLVTRLARLESSLRAASGEGDGSAAGTDVPDAASGAGGRRRPGATGDEPQRALRSLLQVERLREDLESCLAAGRDEVVWVAGGDRASLRSAPLDVSTTLRAQVFEQMPAVLTSATMVPGIGSRLGAEEARLTELDVGSPFDYGEHSLLYCAVHLPPRRSAGFEGAMHEELRDLIAAAGGRTLALFTSRRGMELAAAALRPKLDWPVHLQGELQKPALLRAFSEEEESCLFATMSFWQGVDVPGPSLSLVVIDRLPFPRPDEPLSAARREAAGADGFAQVDLPRAATLLAQGAGRLIRTSTDRGVVAVLDPRLALARYSSFFVRSLPPMRRTRSKDDAVAFLRELHDAEAPAVTPVRTASSE